MTHAALTSGSVAVITGGAAGIGLAAAKRMAQLGLRVCIADLGADRLVRAAEEVAILAAGGADDVMTLETDVSRVEDLRRLEAAVRDRFGGTDVLMNNAGIQPGSAMFGPAGNWERVLDVNLWGVIHSTQIFVPAMIKRGSPPLPGIRPITCPRRA
jgi:NAD(P)-dependent dehydrogenase (short-subunit alcohol dehydrogenase family)